MYVAEMWRRYLLDDGMARANIIPNVSSLHTPHKIDNGNFVENIEQISDEILAPFRHIYCIYSAGFGVINFLIVF